jgi:hypothetical protein
MSNQHLDPWSPEEIDTLRVQWAKGASAGEISKLIGRTRNAIIGRIDRMGLSRPDCARRIPRRRSAYAAKGTRPYRSKAGTFLRKDWSAPAGLPIEFRNIKNDQCRYICGEVRAFETPMCGVSIVEGYYCGYHYNLTHRGKHASVASRAVALAAVPSPDPPLSPGAAALSTTTTTTLPMVGEDGSVGNS